MTRIKEANVKPVIVINRPAIKPGAINEFIEAQLNYASTLMEKPTGLIGSGLYRGFDGRTVVVVSQFESIKAQEEIFQLPAFKENLSKLQAFVESSCPAIYEAEYTTRRLQMSRFPERSRSPVRGGTWSETPGTRMRRWSGDEIAAHTISDFTFPTSAGAASKCARSNWLGARDSNSPKVAAATAVLGCPSSRIGPSRRPVSHFKSLCLRELTEFDFDRFVGRSSASSA
jgi:heme-degrading monooxygenase HmoA